MQKIIFISSLCGLLLFWACSGGAPQMPPQQVSVYTVEGQTIPVMQEFIGEVSGRKDIAIRARVEGYLEGVHFNEGSEVKKGDHLYSIEAQPYEADVAAMQSRVAEAKTNLAKAKSDLDRYKPLAAENAVSQADLDAAQAMYDAGMASLNAARANLRAAQIQLSYTEIYSPINGMIGKTQARVGDFVGRDPNPVILNTVSQIDTVFVDFFVTEEQYLMAYRNNQRRQSSGEAERQLTLQMVFTDGTLFPETGVIRFIDRGVEENTGSIRVQCAFPNPQQMVRPGQFVRVVLKLNELENAIAVPQRSLTELQGRFRVFVVNAENKVEMREVEVGSKHYNFVMIRNGLQVGDQVIYEGLQRARDGAVVAPKVVDVQIIKPQS
jgi:membrane fusion protein (multidrug efflux system)